MLRPDNHLLEVRLTRLSDPSLSPVRLPAFYWKNKAALLQVPFAMWLLAFEGMSQFLLYPILPSPTSTFL